MKEPPAGVEGITKEDLARLLREAEAAHAEYEATLGRRDDDWPSWYADFIVEKLKQVGRSNPSESSR